MGDRRNVVLNYEKGRKIWLYTYWRGSILPDMVARALERGQPKWHAPSYLARIIFCDMIKGGERMLTGFGISTHEIDTNYEGEDIFVDLEGGRAGIGAPNYAYSTFIRKYKEKVQGEE